MSFSPEWLALRRDADDRARSAALTTELVRAVAGRPALRILDLGCGAGANLAALAPRLPGRQTWVLADNDPDLLSRIRPPAGVGVELRHADIAGDLDALFDEAPDLVTASAFFDLCGASLADRIVRRVVAAGAIFHTVLTYDGRETWTPSDPLDGPVIEAFLADQRRDKGLGPALGPAAVAHLARALRGSGYQVRLEPSDWDLRAPADAAMIGELADGHAAAARAALGSAAETWRSKRQSASRAIIGHRDLLALPPR